MALGFHTVSHLLQQEKSGVSRIQAGKGMFALLVPLLMGKGPFAGLCGTGKMSRVALGFHVVSHLLQQKKSGVSALQVC